MLAFPVLPIYNFQNNLDWNVLLRGNVIEIIQSKYCERQITADVEFSRDLDE